MSKAIKEWMINQAEKLSDDEGCATFVRARGTDALYEYTHYGASVSFRGWWYDGESAADIQWVEKPVNGWPENLADA